LEHAGEKGKDRRLVEGGIVSGELPAFGGIRSHHHAENAARIGLYVAADGGDRVLPPGRMFGPFPGGAIGLRFSPEGAHWGFTAPMAYGTVKVYQ
jgi:hypothetical protein